MCAACCVLTLCLSASSSLSRGSPQPLLQTPCGQLCALHSHPAVPCRDWEVVGSQVSLSPSQSSQISVVQNLLVATVTFQVPISCDGTKTLTVGLGGQHHNVPSLIGQQHPAPRHDEGLLAGCHSSTVCSITCYLQIYLATWPPAAWSPNSTGLQSCLPLAGVPACGCRWEAAHNIGSLSLHVPQLGGAVHPASL